MKEPKEEYGWVLIDTPEKRQEMGTIRVGDQTWIHPGVWTDCLNTGGNPDRRSAAGRKETMRFILMKARSVFWLDANAFGVKDTETGSVYPFDTMEHAKWAQSLFNQNPSKSFGFASSALALIEWSEIKEEIAK